MLNDVQIGLLKEARKRIEEEKDTFICCALRSSVQVVSDVYYHDRYEQCQLLKSEIETGINGKSCMELWLFSETGIYPEYLDARAYASWNKSAYVGWKIPMTRSAHREMCRMARLAWIDRALETGKLI